MMEDRLHFPRSKRFRRRGFSSLREGFTHTLRVSYCLFDEQIGHWRIVAVAGSQISDIAGVGDAEMRAVFS